MAYPADIYSPRTKENLPDVVYDSGETTRLFAEDVTQLDSELVAIETELGINPAGAFADVVTRLNDVDSDLAGKEDTIGFTPENVANKKTDLSDDSDTFYASQKAVKTAVDAKLDESLDASPNSDHSANGPKASLVAGANLVFGDVCYMGSDGKMEESHASVVATAFAFAFALATIAEDASGSFALAGCFIRDDSWNWTSVGQPVYLSLTAGALTQTPPSATDEVIQIIGIAITADIIYFNPQLVQVEHV